MNNFIFYNPTKVNFGKNVIKQLPVELCQLGVRKILFLYGMNSIKKNGLYEQISILLSAAEIEFVEHGGVAPNPRISHVREGVRLVKDHQLDLILAVGGGSVIDEAKAIASGACVDFDVWDFFTHKERVNNAIPIVAACTLPATASEMNGFSVVTNEDTKEKNAIAAPGLLNPKVSFLDPQWTFSLSPAQTAFACVDILSHLTEKYFTTSADRLPVQDNLIEGLAKSNIEAMDKLLVDPYDYDARAAFMWGATQAWNGNAHYGIPDGQMPCHGLEMPMSGIYDIAHGAGLSVITPAWIQVAGDKYLPRLQRFFREVFRFDSNDPEELAGRLKQWYVNIGAPITMKEAGIDCPDIDRLAQASLLAFEQRGISGYTLEMFLEIFELAR